MATTSPRSITGLLTLSLACCSFLGCSEPDSPPRYQVEGHVRVDGAPLQKGLISFTPLAPTAGPKAAGVVTDGKYVIEAHAGPCQGKFLVKIETMPHDIEALAAGKPPWQAAHQAEPPRPVIAPKYNQQSQLQVEVRPDAENRFDFEVEAVDPLESNH